MATSSRHLTELNILCSKEYLVLEMLNAEFFLELESCLGSEVL